MLTHFFLGDNSGSSTSNDSKLYEKNLFPFKSSPFRLTDEKIKSFHNRIRLDIYRFSRQIAHKTHKITNWTTANRLQK